MDSVIDNLPGDFQLKPFLDLHKAEVGTMLLTEYNEIEREEFLLNSGRKEGMEKGRKEGIVSAAKNMMETLKMSFEQVAEILKNPTDEYENYRKALKIQ